MPGWTLRAVALALLVAGRASGADDPFELIELPSEGRVVSAELADFDGDGRSDILAVAYRGVPVEDERVLMVYFQEDSGRLPTEPSLALPLPAGAAAYDVAQLDARPGVELILLRPQGLTVLSLAGRTPVARDLEVARQPTVGALADERGLDRLRIAWPEFGDPPWLLVPGFGEISVLRADGTPLARLNVGGRANYFIPPDPGPLVGESQIELYFDFPRLSSGDVNGDGRADLVAATRHELRVFLQTPDGGMGEEPDRVLPFRRITEEDHIRGSGAIRANVRDIDGDGRADLLLSQTRGALTDAEAETSIYANRDGSWDLNAPERVYRTSGGFALDQLVDLDSDGLPDLVRTRLQFSVLELVEALVTRELDVDIAIHRARPSGWLESRPWIEQKLDVPWSFETFRPKGFIPTLGADLNGDGYRDLLTSGDGDRIEVRLGGPQRRFSKKNAEQEFDTRGQVLFGDLEGDGLTDLVVHDPTRRDLPIRIARNRGILPGSPPRLTPGPDD